MRLHNFFLEQKLKNVASGEILVADPEKIHQWLRVFRFGPGDRIVLLDDSGFEFESEFVAISPGGATLRILEARENMKMPLQEVFLFQSLIKNDKFEWILQKATELGVSRVMPILADRSEKKNLNLARCKKIVTEAAEQCGRGRLPKFYEVMKLEESFDQYDAKAVVFHPDAPRFDKRDFLNDKRLAVFIGPEGGWSDRELSLFKEKSVSIYSFSSLVLRSETAAIAISSLILL
ncbi:MAG TPA: RsmE family RNA methyltransferase [Candidatus Paceibacterota bacterium]